jgi:hypothetical protein
MGAESCFSRHRQDKQLSPDDSILLHRATYRRA